MASNNYYIYRKDSGLLVRVSITAPDNLSPIYGYTQIPPSDWTRGRNYPVFISNGNSGSWKYIKMSMYDSKSDEVLPKTNLPNTYNAVPVSVAQLRDYLFGPYGIIKNTSSYSDSDYEGISLEDLYNKKFNDNALLWNEELKKEIDYQIRKQCYIKFLQSYTNQPFTDFSLTSYIRGNRVIVSPNANWSDISAPTSAATTLDLSLYEGTIGTINSGFTDIIYPNTVNVGDTPGFESNPSLKSITYLNDTHSIGSSTLANLLSVQKVYIPLATYTGSTLAGQDSRWYFYSFIEDLEYSLAKIFKTRNSSFSLWNLKILNKNFLEGKTVNTKLNLPAGTSYNELTFPDIMSDKDNYRAYYSLRETFYRIIDNILVGNRALKITNLDLTSCYHMYQDEYYYLNYQFRDSFFSNPNFNYKDIPEGQTFNANHNILSATGSLTAGHLYINNIDYPDGKFQIMEVCDKVETVNGESVTVEYREYPYTYQYLNKTYTYAELNASNLTYGNLTNANAKGYREYSDVTQNHSSHLNS